MALTLFVGGNEELPEERTMAKKRALGSKQPKRADKASTSPASLIEEELRKSAGPRYQPPRRALEPTEATVFRRRLEMCRRAFEKGNRAALFEALFWCKSRSWDDYQMQPPPIALRPTEVVNPGSADYQLEIPLWVWEAATEVVRRDLDSTAVGRGRSARWIQRWRQDQIDFARWQVVKNLRDQGVKFTDGSSMGLVWKEASKRLAKSASRGGPEAVKKSYSKVASEMKINPFRYIVFSHIWVSGLRPSSPAD